MSDLIKKDGPSGAQIIIKDLWKVYGRDPKRILRTDLREKSKEEIQKKTGCIVGLRQVNLEIMKGDFYVLMGLSGSGKSTLVRNLIRLVNSTSGSIVINGDNVTAMGPEKLLKFRRKTFGMVFQHYGLLPHLTVLDNAAYGLKVRGTGKDERYQKAMEVLETVGLKGWEDYHPDSLSGGMQQRVGLARALANDPEILLMDEPFSGLDPLIRRQMQDELVELQDKLQKTIIFVTHDLHEALKLGDRIAIMRNGEVVQEGSPEQIVTQPADEYVKQFVQDASPAKILTAESIMAQPKVLLYNWEGPKTALTLLRKNKRNAAFVVDKNHHFMGVARDEILQDLIKQKDIPTKIPEDCLEKVLSASEDMIVEDLFSIISSNPYPVPILNEDGKLKGVVTTDLIFGAITPNNGG